MSILTEWFQGESVDEARNRRRVPGFAKVILGYSITLLLITAFVLAWFQYRRGW